ncbi:hypothetical protein HCN44_000741 [Aphidius gifuensis]|uniref:Uncharacterized protein n=2 Tax=Aphidius gifuensis TaxID=684658 RepID=A0A834XRK5_APHGI|nr:hypothetical protein HCN44_000741 [Aphidius gifuensis]
MPSRIRNFIRHYDVEKNENTRYNYDKKKIAIIIFILFVCVLIAFGILFKINSRDNCEAKSMKYSKFENYDNATESQDDSKTSLLVTSSIMEDSSRPHVTDEDNTGTITTDKETESYDSLETSSLITSTENYIIKKSSSFNNDDDTVTTTTDREYNITTLSLTKTTDQVVDYKFSITQDLSSSTVIYEQSSTEGI